MTKLTIAQKLEEIKVFVGTEVFTDGSTIASFLDDRIEKSQRKSSGSKTGKVSKRSQESAERRQAIYGEVVSYLKEKGVDMVAGFQIVESTQYTSGQVTSALVALAKEGKLVGHESAVTTDRGHKVKGYEVVG